MSDWFGSVPWRNTSSQSEMPSPSVSAFGSIPVVFFHSMAKRAGVRRTPFVQSRSAMDTPFATRAPSTRQTMAASVFVPRMASAFTPFVPICAPMTRFVAGGSSASEES